MHPSSPSNARNSHDSTTSPAGTPMKGRPQHNPEELPVSGIEEEASSLSPPWGPRPASAPGQGQGQSLEERRPGTGRFYSDELSCFKRVPSPSALCFHKAQLYFESAGRRKSSSEASLLMSSCGSRMFHSSHRHSVDSPGMRKTLSLGSLCRSRMSHPFARGDLDALGMSDFGSPSERSLSKGGQLARLPEEERTATILEKIYPRSPSSPSYDEVHKVQFSRPRSSCQGSRPSTGLSDCGRKVAEQSQKQRSSAHMKLMTFRQKILDRFSTMQVAFDAFAASVGSSTKELPRKEFSRFLNKHFPGLSREEHDQIFDFLDADKNGNVSVQEFTTAVEAATPVRTIEDLRRKWIALGFASMRQVITQMDRSKESSGRLTLSQFGALLSKVGVIDEDEHANIFEAISDPNHPCDTVSLTELASALAAVSPSLVLEDINDRLIKRYGSLIAAFRAIDLNASSSLNYAEFLQHAAHHWKMTPFEAEKAFKLIDLDRNRGIHPIEFMGSLKLSESTLFLEDVRRKVRQRFNSIHDALHNYYPLERSLYEMQVDSPKEGGGGEGGRKRSRPRGSLERASTEEHLGVSARHSSARDLGGKLKSSDELYKILADVQLSQQDTKALFELVDINHDGALSAVEIAWGIRLFAPSCTLENLRLRCLRSHSRVADAFASLPAERHGKLLDARELRQVLEELKLAEGVNVEAVHDLVEQHRTGGTTIRELIAALQAAAPSGGVVVLPPEERDARARQQIRWQMAPFHRSAIEFRSHVRQKLFTEDDERRQAEDPAAAKAQSLEAPSKYSSPDRRASMPAVSPLRRAGKESQSKSKASLDGAELKKEAQAKSTASPDVAEHPPMKQSYSKVSGFLQDVMEPADSEHILVKLHGYYSSAGSKVANDLQLLSTQPSRWQQFKNSSGHYQTLGKPLL